MPHHRDAAKRMRQNRVRRARNRHYRSRMRNQVKKVLAAVEAQDRELALREYREAVSVIQRLASKGIIHRKQAARRVSRLSRVLNAAAGSGSP